MNKQHGMEWHHIRFELKQWYDIYNLVILHETKQNKTKKEEQIVNEKPTLK